MSVTVIGSEKGGVSKSTLCINLAVLCVLEGVDTLLVDADVQGSYNEFSQKRDAEDITPRIPVIQKRGGNLHREIKGLAERYECVIVDTGGRDSVELRSSLLIADTVLVPVQASQFDLWTVDKTFDILTKGQDFNPDLRPLVVIARASPNILIRAARDAMDFLHAFPGVRVCETIIYERIAWQKSIRQGRGVVELNPQDAKASHELRLLYEEVFGG